MPLLAGLFVCLRLCMLAGDISVSPSRPAHSGLDRAAPAWGQLAPALRESQPTHSPTSQDFLKSKLSLSEDAQAGGMED